MNWKHLSAQKKQNLDLDSGQSLSALGGSPAHPGILGWVLGDHSAKTFQPLWELVGSWKCYFYVTDGWPVYPIFIPDGDQIICKTYMTRVEGENTRLRHYLARASPQNTLLF